jgi:hypothetical protein
MSGDFRLKSGDSPRVANQLEPAVGLLRGGQPGLLRAQVGSPNTQDLSRNPPALADP